MTLIGMQQDRAAMPAGIVDRVIARIEDRRGADDGADRWSGNGLQADLAMSGLVVEGHVLATLKLRRGGDPRVGRCLLA